MQLEIGKIYDGKVTGITNYGAFVEVPVEGSKPVTGMVHISEVSSSFIKDIHEKLSEGDVVKVKVIEIDNQGRINLSIRDTMPKPEGYVEEEPRRREPRQNRERRNGGRGDRPNRGFNNHNDDDNGSEKKGRRIEF